MQAEGKYTIRRVEEIRGGLRRTLDGVRPRRRRPEKAAREETLEIVAKISGNPVRSFIGEVSNVRTLQSRIVADLTQLDVVSFEEKWEVATRHG